MKLFQRLTVFLALCIMLTSVPALGAEVDEIFPALEPYPGFVDVEEESWYFENVRLCCETGLMQGMGNSFFAPSDRLTVAQAATVAARVLEAVSRNPIPEPDPAKVAMMGQGLPWWCKYTDYLVGADPTLASLLSQPNEPITRMGFFRMLSLSAIQDLLIPINQVSALPDTSNPDVLAFYNAGILTGMDKYGTFAGDRLLTRAECAAMLSRVAAPTLRLSVVLADYSPFAAAGVTPEELFFPGVTAEAYLAQVNSLIAHLENICAGNRMEFNWFNHYGDRTFLEYVKETALSELKVTAAQGTAAYQSFDVQSYYRRLSDISGRL